MSTDEVLKLVMKNLDEVKVSIRRVHERIDEMYKAGLVTRGECETHRQKCPASKRVSIGTTVLVGLTSSLVTGILVTFLNYVLRG